MPALPALLVCLAALAGAATEPAAGDDEPGGQASQPAVEIRGTWYLLVHYRDDDGGPDAIQWHDAVWRFADEGSRLAWTEYVHFEFRNATGRTETFDGDREARTLGAWEPNEAQLAEIHRGIEIDSRGARTKSLRGSPSRGYASSGSLHSQSTSVIGYHESWRITGLPSRPVFSRVDAMGSGRTEGISDATEYTTEEVVDGGDELRGRYRRDSWEGRFRLIRMERESAGETERGAAAQ